MLLAMTGGVAGIAPLLMAVTAQPAWAFVAPVKITGDNGKFEFSPAQVTISVGDGVTWVNNTDKTHTMTSTGKDAFDSDERGPGEDYSRRFEEAGRFEYRCKIHPKMIGLVVVEPESTTTTTVKPSTTTTTAPPATTTTTAPPSTTTTEPPTTTTTGRPPAGIVPPPPVPTTAAAPPPTLATSSTTTVPPSTTSTAPATTTSAPAPDEQAAPGTAPPTTGEEPTTTTGEPGDEIDSAMSPASRDSGSDPATVALVTALIAVGLFGAWTLIRVRPGRV